MAETEERPEIAAIVAFVNSSATEGEHWKVTHVNSVTDSPDGAEVDAVLCSGDLCAMKKFTVTKGDDGEFSVVEQNAGFI